MLGRILLTSGLLALGAPGYAATFGLIDANTAVHYGTFDAPLAGGLLTAANFTIAGGIFNVLAAGADAPIFTGDGIDGVGAAFGSVLNSNSFDYSDGINTLTCGIGDCVLQFESPFGDGTPGEWYVEDFVNFNNVDFGYYEVIPPAIVPIPAAGLLLFGGLFALFARRLRSL